MKLYKREELKADALPQIIESLEDDYGMTVEDAGDHLVVGGNLAAVGLIVEDFIDVLTPVDPAEEGETALALLMGPPN